MVGSDDRVELLALETIERRNPREMDSGKLSTTQHFGKRKLKKGT